MIILLLCMTALTSSSIFACLKYRHDLQVSKNENTSLKNEVFVASNETSVLKGRLSLFDDQTTEITFLRNELAASKTATELLRQEKEILNQAKIDWIAEREKSFAQSSAILLEQYRNERDIGIAKQSEVLNKTMETAKLTDQEMLKQIEQLQGNIKQQEQIMLTTRHEQSKWIHKITNPGEAGNLSELTLENILKSSLRECDYKMQPAMSEGSFRPDAVIRLPQNHWMIIDSKSSKFYYEIIRAENIANGEKDLERRRAYLASMKNHREDLIKRGYEKRFLEELVKKEQLGEVATTLDKSRIVLVMFVAQEEMLYLLDQIDSNFVAETMQKGIHVVSMHGLSNLLRQTRHQIDREGFIAKQEEAKKLIVDILGAISRASGHASKIGRKIDTLVNDWNEFASSFNGNFLKKAVKCQALGVGVEIDFKALELSKHESNITIINSEDQ